MYILNNLGHLDTETEELIKSRSISAQDNPNHYKDRLRELDSEEYEHAVYAYGVRKLTNAKNISKLKEHAMKSKKSYLYD
jgi:hypothetical protein